MSTDITSLVNNIPERQPATITLTDPSGKRVQVPCTFTSGQAPSFVLLFSPGSIPADIETDWRCILFSKDKEGIAITFAATIIDLSDHRAIKMTANKSIRPEDLREYFRVNLKATIEVFYHPTHIERDEQALEVKGETVDLSQSGVLTILSDECTIKKPVMITMDLPNPAKTIICSASLIRSKQLRKNRWLTAFHFVDIPPKTRDIIAKNCFAEQRRQLRNNIETVRS